MNLNLKYGACIFKFIENVKEIKKKRKKKDINGYVVSKTTCLNE